MRELRDNTEIVLPDHLMLTLLADPSSHFYWTPIRSVYAPPIPNIIILYIKLYSSIAVLLRGHIIVTAHHLVLDRHIRHWRDHYLRTTPLSCGTFVYTYTPCLVMFNCLHTPLRVTGHQLVIFPHFAFVAPIRKHLVTLNLNLQKGLALNL